MPTQLDKRCDNRVVVKKMPRRFPTNKKKPFPADKEKENVTQLTQTNRNTRTHMHSFSPLSSPPPRPPSRAHPAPVPNRRLAQGPTHTIRLGWHTENYESSLLVVVLLGAVSSFLLPPSAIFLLLPPSAFFLLLPSSFIQTRVSVLLNNSNHVRVRLVHAQEFAPRST